MVSCQCIARSIPTHNHRRVAVCSASGEMLHVMDAGALSGVAMHSSTIFAHTDCLRDDKCAVLT